jgi:hypothetical protein
MPAPSKCPQCGLELGQFVETHCPQCGVSLAPKPPMTVGVWLLDLMIAISGTLFVMGSVFGLPLYLNSSSSAELYAGQPYHATTFRVISVQYSQTSDPLQQYAYGLGMVEGKREMMDLIPYIGTLPTFHNKNPTNQLELKEMVPEGTSIPVYLFPNLEGVNRVQLILSRPTAESYARLATWTTNHAFPVVALCGLIAALLGFARYAISRSARRRLAADAFVSM